MMRVLSLSATLILAATTCAAMQIPTFEQTLAVNSPFLYTSFKLWSQWAPSQEEDASDAIAEWWRGATDLGGRLKADAENNLAEVQKTFKDKAEQIETLWHLVEQTTSKAVHVGDLLVHGDMDEVHEELSSALEQAGEKMRETFPPPEEAQGHDARRDDVRRTLEIAIEEIVRVTLPRVSVPEEELRMKVDNMCAPLEDLVILVGDLVEQHPVLAETLIISVTVLVTDRWLLRPLVRLLGFGPLGPVRGSFAAWAQRQFFGAITLEGSWFAALQRAGMKPVGGIFKHLLGWLVWR